MAKQKNKTQEAQETLLNGSGSASASAEATNKEVEEALKKVVGEEEKLLTLSEAHKLMLKGAKFRSKNMDTYKIKGYILIPRGRSLAEYTPDPSRPDVRRPYRPSYEDAVKPIWYEIN